MLAWCQLCMAFWQILLQPTWQHFSPGSERKELNLASLYIHDTGSNWLIFSAPEPKAQVHYCDHVLSVVRRPSVVNFSHFRLLLWNHWTEFHETWQEGRSQRPLPSLCFFRADWKIKWIFRERPDPWIPVPTKQQFCCMNYEGKYYGHEFLTPRMCGFCSVKGIHSIVILQTL